MEFYGVISFPATRRIYDKTSLVINQNRTGRRQCCTIIAHAPLARVVAEFSPGLPSATAVSRMLTSHVSAADRDLGHGKFNGQSWVKPFMQPILSYEYKIS